MANVGDTSMTFSELAKRFGPGDQQIGKVIEILNQTNPILEDAPAMEANNGTTHLTTTRTGLPEAFWRLINRGVPKSKSRTAQVTEETGVMETWSEVDNALLEINNNKAALLLSESKAFLEGMNQQMAETLFYGSRKENPAAFTGLAHRYSAVSGAESSKNVIDMGGTGAALTSVWLNLWGDNTMHLLFPKGTKAGVSFKTYPDEIILDEDGNQFTGHKTHYKWYIGFALRDWRYAVRLANIDSTLLDTLVTGGAADAAKQMLVRAMIRAYNLIPNMAMGRACWYMNREVKTMLELMAAEKTNVNLTIETFEGKSVTKFRGIPIRQCDAIINGETQVV